MYLENKRAARRNRDALLAQAGAGAFAAFLGAPQDTAPEAAPAAARGRTPPSAAAASRPRYSSGGEVEGAGDVKWALQSTQVGHTLTEVFAPRLGPADLSSAAEERPPPPPVELTPWEPVPADPPTAGTGPPLHLLPGDGVSPYRDSGVGDLCGAAPAGAELHVFPAAMAAGAARQHAWPPAVSVGRQRRDAQARQPAPQPDAVLQTPARPGRRSWGGDADAVAGLSQHLAQQVAVQDDAVPRAQTPARPGRRSWGGDAAAVAGLSGHLAQQDSGVQGQQGSGDITAGSDSLESLPRAADAVHRGHVAAAGERGASPWPEVVDVDLGGWQPGAKVHKHSGTTEELPGSGTSGDVPGLKWGQVVDPALGEGTARQLTAGSGLSL